MNSASIAGPRPLSGCSKLVARHVPAGVKLTDELIAERRREARREAERA